MKWKNKGGRALPLTCQGIHSKKIPTTMASEGLQVIFNPLYIFGVLWPMQPDPCAFSTLMMMKWH